MDYHIFQWIHNAAGKNSFLDSIMSFASEWGIYVFIGAIILLLFIPSKRNVGIYGVISLATGLIINRVIKLLVDRPSLNCWCFSSGILDAKGSLSLVRGSASASSCSISRICWPPLPV